MVSSNHNRHSRRSFPSIGIRLALVLGGLLCRLVAEDSFTPLSVTLQPAHSISPVPSWESGSKSLPAIHPENASIDLPVPAVSSQEEIGCYALTTVFDDQGDGGPLVEWIAANGERTLLSAGLGESGVTVGLNARTLLIPQAVALDGGSVRVSFAGRFERLVSLTLRPAKELAVAAIPSDLTPGLIGKTGDILSAQEVSGQEYPSVTVDRTDGSVVHAILSPDAIRLDAPGTSGSTEFVIPLAVAPSGCQLRAEVCGLDPESWIEVSVNGENRGVLAPSAFSLDDPSVLLSEGSLRIAGWRSSSLYLPGRLWKAGDNSLILTLHRASTDAGGPVSLRKVTCDLVFPPAAPAPTETLSTGSLYGNPSPNLFHAGSPKPLPIAP